MIYGNLLIKESLKHPIGLYWNIIESRIIYENLRLYIGYLLRNARCKIKYFQKNIEKRKT